MAKGLMSIKFSEQSFAKLKANLARLDISAKYGAKRALKTIATNVMAQSESECPRDTETLVSTAYIEEPVVEGQIVSIKVGYASPTTNKMNPVPDRTGRMKMASEYALIVHETPGTPPGGGNYHPYGKWKYLEDPVRAHQGAFFAAFAREMKVVLARGVKSR